jgi:ribonuclease P protein component
LGLRDDQKIKWEFCFKRNSLKSSGQNYFKRILRETYRLNKHILLKSGHALFFHVLLPDQRPLEEINTKTIQLFEKFIAQNTKAIQ